MDRCAAVGLSRTDSRRNLEGVESGQKGGMFPAEWGEVLVRKGHYVNIHSRIAGTYPPNCSRNGVSLCTLLRHRAVSPNHVQEKKEENVRAQHGLRAACQRVRIGFEAGWGTRGHLPRVCFPHNPVWLKWKGVYPRLTITQNQIMTPLLLLLLLVFAFVWYLAYDTGLA